MRPTCKRIFLLPALSAVILSSCAQPKETVSVSVNEPEVKIERVKSDTKQKDFDPTMHEIAQTDWIFSIIPELSFSIKDKKEDKKGYHLNLEVTGVKLKLALPIKTTVYEKAPQYVLDHENGHVEICRRIYKNARTYALEAAKNAFGKTYEGFGRDRKLALSNALEMAAQDIAAPYRVNTAGVAERVSANYDRLCEKEDRQKLVGKTIDDAFAAAIKELDDEQKAAKNLRKPNSKPTRK